MLNAMGFMAFSEYFKYIREIALTTVSNHRAASEGYARTGAYGKERREREELAERPFHLRHDDIDDDLPHNFDENEINEPVEANVG